MNCVVKLGGFSDHAQRRLLLFCVLTIGLQAQEVLVSLSFLLYYAMVKLLEGNTKHSSVLYFFSSHLLRGI